MESRARKGLSIHPYCNKVTLATVTLRIECSVNITKIIFAMALRLRYKSIVFFYHTSLVTPTISIVSLTLHKAPTSVDNCRQFAANSNARFAAQGWQNHKIALWQFEIKYNAKKSRRFFLIIGILPKKPWKVKKVIFCRPGEKRSSGDGMHWGQEQRGLVQPGQY